MKIHGATYDVLSSFYSSLSGTQKRPEHQMLLFTLRHWIATIKYLMHMKDSADPLPTLPIPFAIHDIITHPLLFVKTILKLFPSSPYPLKNLSLLHLDMGNALAPILCRLKDSLQVCYFLSSAPSSSRAPMILSMAPATSSSVKVRSFARKVILYARDLHPAPICSPS